MLLNLVQKMNFYTFVVSLSDFLWLYYNIFSFNFNFIMHLKKFYHIAIKVSSKKGATTFSDLPDCLTNDTIALLMLWEGLLYGIILLSIDITFYEFYHDGSCWDIITQPCLNPSGCSAKPSLGLRHGWEITTYSFIITVTSQWTQRRLKSLVSRLFAQPFDADQRKHQSSASLTFVRGIHRWPVDSPYKGPATRKNVSICWRHHLLA